MVKTAGVHLKPKTKVKSLACFRHKLNLKQRAKVWVTLEAFVVKTWVAVPCNDGAGSLKKMKAVNLTRQSFANVN